MYRTVFRLSEDIEKRLQFCLNVCNGVVGCPANDPDVEVRSGDHSWLIRQNGAFSSSSHRQFDLERIGFRLGDDGQMTRVLARSFVLRKLAAP
jgi:hypothetical protein